MTARVQLQKGYMVVKLKGLVAKANGLAINSQL
jgi:hypothetical protein